MPPTLTSGHLLKLRHLNKLLEINENTFVNKAYTQNMISSKIVIIKNFNITLQKLSYLCFPVKFRW